MNLPDPARVAALVAILLVATFQPAHAWRQTRFLIGGWSINDAHEDPVRLLRFSEAGIDFLQDNAHHFDLALGRQLAQHVDSLRRVRPDYRVQVVLHDLPPDGVVGHITNNPEPGRHWGEVRRRMAAGAGRGGDAVLGWFVWDEPCTRAEMARIADFIHAFARDDHAATQVPFVNLLPLAEFGSRGCYESEFGPGLDRRAAYGAYLDAYLSAFDGTPQAAPFLSIDHYPFQIDGRVGSAYFENLRIARERAAAHGRAGVSVPLWVIVQLASFKPPDRPYMQGPTLAQVRWQVWTAIAYGAKSISYWTIGTTTEMNPVTAFRGGLLELDARPTAKYEPVRRLDAELHALGPTLMRLEPVFVWHVDPGSQRGVDDERLDRAGAGNVVRRVTGEGAADCMIGVFRERAGTRTYLLVVNKSLESSRRFRLELGRIPGGIDRIDGASGAARRLPADGAALNVGNLEAASGRLFRLR